MEKRQEIGQELKRRRLAAKLSQEVLGEAAGVSRKGVAEVESGRMEYPIDHFIRYCNALDVPILPVGFDIVIRDSFGAKKPFDIH